ncbi:MAG: hypothetical protein JJU02_00625 [Cryomorphaceae bacterium]|nr:hypothetical protein [Cryomorphaceae bacterium]
MRILLIALFVFPLCLVAQRKDKEEKIVYFTDANVKRSSISVAADGSGFYSNRSRIGGGFTPGQGSLNDDLPKSNGVFGWNSGFHIVWRVASSLEIWSGVSYASGGWIDKHTYLTMENEIPTQTNVYLDFINIPIQFSFRSEMNELWDLEVLPMFEFNLLNRYSEDIYHRNNTDVRIESRDMASEARRVNYTIGLSLSGRYKFDEHWSLFIRPFFHYMFNSLIDDPERPREVLYGVGLSTGVRFQFN